MARLWSCGFELQMLSSFGEFYSPFGSAGSISTTIKHGGNASLRTNVGGVVNLYRFVNIFRSSNSDLPHYARVYLRIDMYPHEDLVQFLAFQNSTGLGWAKIMLNSDGTLNLRNDEILVGGKSPVLTLGQWYKIDLSYFNNTVSGKSEMEARVNGVTFASTTQGLHTGGINQIICGLTSYTTHVDVYFDDLAINDNSGSYENSWPGEGKIIHLKPNGVGFSNQWLKNSGGAGDTNNYALVNEIIPDDAISYIKSKTLNEVDNYSLEKIGLGGKYKVKVVQVGSRQSCSAISGVAHFKDQLILNSTVLGIETTPWSTSWRTNPTINLYIYSITAYEDGLGGQITPEVLDSAKIGVVISVAGTQYCYITTMWLLVEYVDIDYLPADKKQPSGYHCFISQFVKNMYRGFIPLLTPDAVNRCWQA